MTGLMKRGVDAAYHVVRYDRDAFVQAFAADLGGEARLRTPTTGRCRSMTPCSTSPSATCTRAPRPDRQRSRALVLDPHRVPANAGDVLAYPTLENLFGSMDFCACDHCRSILSPAAYLVDLLHFIDQPHSARRYREPADGPVGSPPGHSAPAADLREHQHGPAVHRRGQRDARILHRQQRSEALPPWLRRSRHRRDGVGGPAGEPAVRHGLGVHDPGQRSASRRRCRSTSPWRACAAISTSSRCRCRWRWSGCARAMTSSAAPIPTAGATS